MAVLIEASTDGRRVTCIPTPMLDKEQARNYLGLNKACFDMLYKKGEIFRRLPGRGRGFHIDDLNKFLDSYTGTHSTPPISAKHSYFQNADAKAEVATEDEIDELLTQLDDDNNLDD